MPLNFDLAGKTYPSQTITVTAEQIEAYAEASGDGNPRHRADAPDQVASAVFAVVPGIMLAGQITTDPELNVENPLMIVHGEQAFDYHRPIRPGDGLVMTPVLESVDLAICHLETPIAPEGEEFTTMPRYGVPAEIVK